MHQLTAGLLIQHSEGEFQESDAYVAHAEPVHRGNWGTGDGPAFRAIDKITFKLFSSSKLGFLYSFDPIFCLIMACAFIAFLFYGCVFSLSFSG